MSTTDLSVSGVKKTYEGKTRFEAIRDVTFDLNHGELACLVGPSGSGKTTLLRCMAGLLSPTEGEIRLGEELVSGPPKDMAVVFQEYGRSLFPWLTVQANVELPLRARGTRRADRERDALAALESVGLSDARSKYPWQLSGGMQQRVAIARAIATKPRVLLMDEPFAAVDAQTRAELEDLIRRVWKESDVTILFVTHDIDESVYLGERVLVLSAAPTLVQRDIHIDLPDVRDQLTTRSLSRFAELRNLVYAEVQRAKLGAPGADAGSGSAAPDVHISAEQHTPSVAGARR